MERSEPFLVYFAARMNKRGNIGLRAVFFKSRPMGSAVRPTQLALAR